MLKIALINMPFAAVHRPSLALTQLKSIITQRYAQQVALDIIYLNQDFAHYIGLELYQDIADGKHYSFGLGDWFFRQVAFPQLADNTREYFLRYYPQQNDQVQNFKLSIQEKRQGLDSYLDTLIDKYRLAQADLIGFTSMFSQNVASFAMAQKIKERRPDAVTFVGGANCEVPMGPEIAKHVPQIDFVFSGPGLISFSTFVQYYLQQTPQSCHYIDGVFSRTNVRQKRLPVVSDRSVLQPESRGIKEIGEEIPVNQKIELDYTSFLDSFEKNFPDKEIEPALLFETSRGCWWGERSHCTFCGLNGLTMNYRAMDSSNAIAQFHSLFQYASRCSTLECVDNILPKEYLKEVFPRLDPPPDVSLFYEVKSSLSEEDVQTLAKARVNSIQPGIESLATSTLQLMKKGSTVFQNLTLLKNCALYDVYPLWNILVGFPGETEEVYQKYLQDLPSLFHLPPPSGVFPVRFDRYSPYFVEMERFGLDLHPYAFYTLTYPFSEDSLKNLAYYFMDHNFGAAYNVTMAKWIGKIRKLFQLWYDLWYEGDQPPKLFMKTADSVPTISDSRSGKVLEYPVTSIGRQVLEQSTKPARISDLAAKLSHLSLPAIEQEIALLQTQKLVFHEKGRFMSLVLPHETPPMQSFIELRRKRNIRKKVVQA